MHMPRPTSIVMRLLIINIAVFLICILFKPIGTFVYQWLQLDASSLTRVLQLWRLISYQFLHSPNHIFHILFNMYVLFFFGRILEPHLGPHRFLVFYLCCGVSGGLFYLLLTAIGFLPALPMVGASGAILGVIGACAVLFPQIKMIIFPIFIPISIRAAAIGGAVFYTLMILMRAQNAGGEAAHLAGMATGAFYAAWPYISVRYNLKSHTSPWQRKIQDQQQLAAQVDRILEKVYKHGISSLSRKEKQILKKATQLHQNVNK
jgi:membrane associated rhomboid family serine protease